jgi:single-strand DNA-binding protein
MLSEAKFTIIGRVGTTEVIEKNGRRRATLSIAVDTGYERDGERVERTSWNRVTTFAPHLVNLIERHVVKGRYLRLTGDIANRSYERDGETVYVTDLLASQLDFLDPRPD